MSVTHSPLKRRTLDEFADGSTYGKTTFVEIGEFQDTHDNTTRYRGTEASAPPTSLTLADTVVEDDQSLRLYLTWVAPSSGYFDGYTLRYAVGDDSSVTIDNESPTIKLSSDALGYVLTGISEGKYIKVAIKAYVVTNTGLLFSDADTLNIDRTAYSVQFGEGQLPDNAIIDDSGTLDRKDGGGVDLDNIDEGSTNKHVTDTEKTGWDEKVKTFYQDSEPTAEATGDLWVDTDDKNKLYRWNGASWVTVRDTDIAQALADAATAQSTADIKARTFYQSGTPTATATGDIWYDTSDNYKMRRWSGSSWDLVTDGRVDAGLSDTGYIKLDVLDLVTSRKIIDLTNGTINSVTDAGNLVLFNLMNPTSGDAGLEGEMFIGSTGRIFLPGTGGTFNDVVGVEIVNSGIRAWTASDQYASLTNAGITVVGGTITGGTIRTAASGQRVVMEGSDNTLKFYNSSGNANITIDSSSNYGYINVYGSASNYIYMHSYDGTFKVYSSAERASKIIFDATLSAGEPLEVDENGVTINVSDESGFPYAYELRGLYIATDATNSGNGRDEIYSIKSYVDTANDANVYGIYGKADSDGSGNKYSIYGAEPGGSGGGTEYSGYFESMVFVGGSLIVDDQLVGHEGGAVVTQADLTVGDDLSVTDDVVIGGQVAINATVENSILLRAIQTSDTYNGGIRLENSGADDWNIYVGAHNSHHLYFYSGSSQRGYLSYASDVGAIDFTGQHRNLPKNNKIKKYKDKIGMIVIATGDYFNLSSSKEQYMPTINEALPIVDLSKRAYDKRVFGVISNIENGNQREYIQGCFVTVMDKKKEDIRLIINSLGEGGMWVCNANGNLENGDLIASSNIPGLGMKLTRKGIIESGIGPDDLLIFQYIVATITQDCNFDLNSKKYKCEELKYKDKIYRKAFVGCTYHCG